MENKNSKDAFASMNLGGSDKYLKRHQEAVRLERANELDKRIAEFDAKKHDIDWAEKAGDFCDRETETGKDLADVSKGFKELARIRKEAESILKAEEKRKINEEKEKERIAFQELADEFDENVNNFVSKPHTVEWANVAIEFCSREKIAGKDLAPYSKTYKSLDNIKKEAKDILMVENARKKAEQEELKRKKQELELQEKQQEDAIVKELSDQIMNLFGAERTKEWLKDVDRVSLTIKGLSKKAEERVANRFMIYSFQNEAQDVKKALEFDEQVEMLKATKQKNKIWAKNVFDLESKIKSEQEKYMKTKVDFSLISFEARKIHFSNELESLESFMKKVEGKDFTNAPEELKKNQKTAEKLQTEIALDNFIDDFEDRWKKVVKDVDAFVEKTRKEEEERLAEIKRKEEEERQRQLEIERQEEELAFKIGKRKRRIKKAIITAFELAVVVAIAVVGIMFFEKPLGKWILSGGMGCALTYFGLKLTYFSRNKKLDIALLYIIDFAVMGINVASVFVSMFELYFLPLLAGVIVVSVVRLRESVNYFVVGSLAILCMIYVLSNMFGVTAIYCGAGVLVLEAIGLSIVTWKNYTYKDSSSYKECAPKLYGSFISSILLSISAIVLMLVFKTTMLETLIASSVGGALLIYFWIVYYNQFTIDGANRYVPFIIIVLILCVLNIIGIFVPSLENGFAPLMVSAVVISLIEGIYAVKEDEEKMLEYAFFGICSSFLTTAGVVLKILLPILGGIYTSLIVVAVLLVMSASVVILFKIYDACDVGKAFFVFPLLLNIFGAVIGWWLNWSFIILGAGALASSILMEVFYVSRNDGYDDWGWLEWGTTFIGCVSLFVAMCFTF